MAKSGRDPCTLSNYSAFLILNTKTDFTIDFTNKCLSGNVTLQLTSNNNGTESTIALDTSYLLIEDVLVDGEPCKWEISPRIEPYGSQLSIHLREPLSNGITASVDVSHFNDWRVRFPKIVDIFILHSRSNRRQQMIALP